MELEPHPNIISKVQTNTYAASSSSHNNINEVSRLDQYPRLKSPQAPENGQNSSLKANIDELDNILTDLNNSIASGLNSRGQTISPSPMPPPKVCHPNAEKVLPASPRPISPAVEFKV